MHFVPARLAAVLALFMALAWTSVARAQLCNPLDPLPAAVERDAYGVPHLFATNVADLAFTNGYVQAEDRLFEMEILRRAGKGTLSEVLGAAYLEMDVAARRDLYTPAEWQAQLDALPLADRQQLEAFADGVTRYICEALLDSSKMPAEYAALGFLPDDWTALDSVAAGDFLIGVFGSFGGDEVRNASFFFDLADRIRRGKAKRVFDDHFPMWDPESPTTIPQTEASYDDPLRQTFRRLSGKQRRILERYVPSIHRAAGVVDAEAQQLARSADALGIPAPGTSRLASNAILVAGALSDTGNALLLGGPQVGYAIPSFFFEIGLHLPTTGAVGVLPPAGPSIVIGRTESFAYTITSGISDQVDTYLEILNPANPRQYEFNDQFVDMDCHIETFTVREPPPPTGSGGPPSQEQRELCRTVHGPVFFIDEAGGAAFSHANAHRNRELESAANWLNLALTTDLAEFVNKLDGFYMSFNFHFADNQGNIGYFHTGIRPLRPRRTDPRFPLPGNGDFEWTGFLQPNELPRIVNPAQGWLANWNNRPVRGWSAGDVRELWGTEHRVQALQEGIERELAADGSLSLDDVNLVMREGARKDAYAGGRGPIDGRAPVAGPYLALVGVVDLLPAGDPDKADLVAGAQLIQSWIESASTIDLTEIKTGNHVARSVHGAPLMDLDGDGFAEHPGAGLYERWRVILQERVFGDELGAFLDRLRYAPAAGANTGDHGGGDTQDSVLVHALSGRSVSGRKTIKYFDDITTRKERETAEFQLVESLRQAMAELGDCLDAQPINCRHANHVNVFSPLGGAPRQTIGSTRGAVNRGSYNQLVELGPTLFSVNVSPPGQSGHVDAALLAQIQAAQTEGGRRQLTDDAHLTDQLEIYELFEYKPMPFTLAEVQAAQ